MIDRENDKEELSRRLRTGAPARRSANDAVTKESIATFVTDLDGQIAAMTPFVSCSNPITLRPSLELHHAADIGMGEGTKARRLERQLREFESNSTYKSVYEIT